MAILTDSIFLLPDVQPVGDVVVDWEHPLASGLHFAAFMSALDPMRLHQVYDYVTRSTANTTNNKWSTSVESNKLGLTMHFDGSVQYARSGVKMKRCRKATIAFWLWIENYTADIKYYLEVNTAGNNAFRIYNNNSVTSIDFRMDRTAQAHILRLSRPAAGAWYHFAITCDRTLAAAPLRAIYLNGLAQSVTTPTNSWNTATDFDDGQTTWMNAQASAYQPGGMATYCVWDRILSADEIYSVYLNPWQMFKPVERALYPNVLVAAPSASMSRYYMAA